MRQPITRVMAAADKADISLRRLAVGLLRKREDAYAADSIELARRIAGTVSILTSLFALAFLPLAPPTEGVGDAGWVIVGVAVVASIGGAARLFDMRQKVSWNELYSLSWVGIAGIGGITWLAGGGDTPYPFLFLLIAAGSALNPPRRSVPFLATCVVVALAPLVYAPGHSDAMLIASVAVWSVVGLLLVIAADGLRHHQLRLVRDERESRELARVDPLTDLGNRRAFDESLAIEVARVRRTPSPLSVALIDLDGLKRINDKLGHLEGDRCLRKVATGIALNVRGIDRVFRWAGDEFAVIFPDTTAAEAALVAERARRAVAGSCHTSDGDPLLVSYGVAQLAEGDPVELIDTADAALFAYKAARPPLRDVRRPGSASSLEE